MKQVLKAVLTKVQIYTVILATLFVGVGAVLVPSASAATTATTTTHTCQGYTGPTYGRWTSTKTYIFSRGGWCMHLGYYRLVFQTDGNLVVYGSTTGYGGTAQWASNTKGTGYTLHFQKDGNLVIYNVHKVAIWATEAYKNKRPTTYSIFYLRFITNSSVFYEFEKSSGYTTNHTLWRSDTGLL